MKYNVKFDFTVVKRGSNLVGKSGEIQIEATTEFSETEISDLKKDKAFEKSIAVHLAETMSQGNIFDVTVKSIQPTNKPTTP